MYLSQYINCIYSSQLNAFALLCQLYFSQSPIQPRRIICSCLPDKDDITDPSILQSTLVGHQEDWWSTICCSTVTLVCCWWQKDVAREEKPGQCQWHSYWGVLLPGNITLTKKNNSRFLASLVALHFTSVTRSRGVSHQRSFEACEPVFSENCTRLSHFTSMSRQID